jgi:hypothetical protein
MTTGLPERLASRIPGPTSRQSISAPFQSSAILGCPADAWCCRVTQINASARHNAVLADRKAVLTLVGMVFGSFADGLFPAS